MKWLLIIFLLLVVAFAIFIDWRRNKNKNHPHIPTNPNTKPGESSNYMMGDNRYTGGGE